MYKEGLKLTGDEEHDADISDGEIIRKYGFKTNQSKLFFYIFFIIFFS
jgi:hypothetical protein